MIRFVVPGHPVAKGRARSGRTANGAPVHYTPVKTQRYEALVKMAAAKAMNGSPPHDRSVPLSMLIVATVPIPGSWSGKKTLRAINQTVLPTGRPDVDNFVKIALDGCKGVVFADDSSVVRLETRKEYGVVPGLTVQVVPLTTVDGA